MPCETSLPLKLQAQTLPDATPPIGKIYPFAKIIAKIVTEGMGMIRKCASARIFVVE